MLTFGSLFAGIGGLDLGLERAGMVCKWQVEIDDYATRVLAKHWPDVPRWRDIRTFPPDADDSTDHKQESKIRTADKRSKQGRTELWSAGCCQRHAKWHVDLICGGFPCQDISYAGGGAGIEGERSGLFFEALRVVRQLQPRFVLLENVAALLSRGLDRVCGELAQIGYDCEWHCIPAAAVGAPHIRDRVFVVAHTAGKRLSGNGAERSNRQPDAIITAGCEKQRWWSVEPNVGRVANGVPSRVDRLRGLGNAVVPQVAEYIGRQICQLVDNRT